MLSLDEMCAIACECQTKMADAMLVACVNEALESRRNLDLRQADVDRYLRLVMSGES